MIEELHRTEPADASSAAGLAPTRIRAIARALADTTEIWWPTVRRDTGSRWYVPLLDADDCEAWLLGWPPAEGIELHDHGQSSGALVVVEGTGDRQALSIHVYSPRLRWMSFYENRPDRGVEVVRTEITQPGHVLV